MSSQIVSKQRVSDHGEVFTNEREVNAMVDLVEQEAERIESRFLEPACGTGNFLVNILERKLAIVEKRFAKTQFNYECNAVLAMSSLYGIDILQDSIEQCRERLFNTFDRHYITLFKNNCKESCRVSVRTILDLNIIHGNALTLQRIDESGPIVFSEWSPVSKKYLKRRDFIFKELIEQNSSEELTLFSSSEPPLSSDLGESVFIAEPHKEYPVTHFLELVYD